MHPDKVQRNCVKILVDLPNIGKAMAADLHLLGIDKPEQLKGENPYDLFVRLCKKTGQKHDPCVIDVFISVTRFMDGEPPQPWWAFTAERKAFLLQAKIDGKI